VDFTAAHMLEQIQGMLAERDCFLIFSQLPRAAPSGQDMKRYFLTLGLVSSERHVRGFRELDAALEWVEDQILQTELREKAAEKPLELHEIEVFKGRKEDTLSELAACVARRSVKEGEVIFHLGDAGDEMFLIRRGAVRIMLPIAGKHSHHLATFGRGDFFGEMTFLDREPRSADAVAGVDTDLFVLSRERFDALADHHKRLGMNLLEGLAKALAIRLRHTNTELRTLEDS
jgi:SulP family sulfate permease